MRTLGVNDVLVPTRIIQTDNEDLITEIVTATNSQTEVRAHELNARAVAERHVEKYFAAQSAPRNSYMSASQSSTTARATL
jgi:AIPR protein